ncbi:hypothetical protein [Thalassomonas haliotis]|uniref:mannan endo-1,4-beta-mannosidase n=1 Tax=Thalassomonas haliotis TaxID=485448 RepID=A0ABY7VI28_9GAMM|nr:hypothetical protein [Thalassomonas haliotis]WDE13128.1 hypothetical protein H3N35_06700 [Thalassomonas haliotis]
MFLFDTKNKRKKDGPVLLAVLHIISARLGRFARVMAIIVAGLSLSACDLDSLLDITAISDDSGVEGDFITNDTRLVIEGTWLGMGHLSVEYQGKIYDIDSSPQLTVQGYRWQLDLSDSLQQDGRYKVTAKLAVKKGSRRFITSGQDIEINTRMPDSGLSIDSISEDTDIDGDFTTSDNSLLVQGSWKSGSGELTVTFNGQQYLSGQSAALSTGENFWVLDVTGYSLAVGEYPVEASVANIAGNSETTSRLIRVAPAPVAVDFVDELIDFGQTFQASYGMARESGDSKGRFNGDDNRLKRVENTREYVEYLFAGDVKSIRVNTFYWTGEAATAPFEVLVSTTGNDYKPLALTAESLATADGWEQVTYSVAALEDGYDFVTVVFPKNNSDANPWHPQLGSVSVSYHQNPGVNDNNQRGQSQPHSPVSGGQAPLVVPQAIKAKTYGQFDYYITRGLGDKGNKLYNGEQEFRFISYNVPELHMQESPYWDAIDAFESEDALKTIAAMGGQVTRSYVLSVYNWQIPSRKLVHIDIEKDANGEPIRDGVLVFNEELLVSLDKALDYANKHGVRIIFPFIDRNSWWGGIESLAALRNLSADDYYSHATLINDYKTIVRTILERTNTISGVRYLEDPAIFAWETGNELRRAPDAWTAEMAAYIKSLDSNHLVIDGKEVDLSEAAMDNPDVDIISNHYYGGDYKLRFLRDWQRLDNRKPFIVGETGVESFNEINDIVTAVADETSASGLLLWSLRSQDAYGGFMDHSEDGTGIHAYHWPGFNENESRYQEQSVINLLWDKAYSIRGLQKPALPAPDGVPVMLPIEDASDIRWQGVTNSQYYDVQRSQTPEDESSWQVIGDNLVVGGTSAGQYRTRYLQNSLGQVQAAKVQHLFSDTSVQTRQRYYYRVKAFNSSGESAYSNVVRYDALFHDPLESLPSGLSDAGKFKLDSSNSANFAADSSRLMRTVNEAQYVNYSFGETISAFELESYLWRGGLEGDTDSFKVQLSSDGSNWFDYPVIAQDKGTINDWQQLKLSGLNIPGGYYQLRIVFPLAREQDKVWASQLGSVKIATGDQTLAATGNWLQDPLTDLSLATSYSAGMAIDNGNAESFGWDSNRVKRSSNAYDAIIYSFDSDIRGYYIDSFLWQGLSAHWGNFKVQLSKDGQIWQDAVRAEAAATYKRGDWQQYSLADFAVATGYRHLKVLYPDAKDANNSWAAQVGQVSIAVAGTAISQ